MNVCCCCQLCQRKNLAYEATRDVLKDLIFNLITILLDARLNELQDGQHVARSVNIAVVKIVEKTEPTNVLRSALLHCAIHNCLVLFVSMLRSFVKMICETEQPQNVPNAQIVSLLKIYQTFLCYHVIIYLTCVQHVFDMCLTCV